MTQLSDEVKQIVAARARDRAASGRWDLNIAVLLFAVLILVIILTFSGVGIVIVAPVSVLSLASVWFIGWRRGKKLYAIYYKQELFSEIEREKAGKSHGNSIDQIA